MGSVMRNRFFEIHKDYADNIVVGFAQAGRAHPSALLPIQPASLAGVLGYSQLRKGRAVHAFLRLFQYTVVGVGGCAGLLPGTDQEWNGIITNGAKLLYALSEATVPTGDRDHAGKPMGVLMM
jgi:propionyl-CoA carboxylase beta chain